VLAKHGPLDRRLAEEQQTFARPLRSLLRRPAVTCARTRTLSEVAALMRVQGVGSVVVVDAQARPVGIVTSHDMIRVAAESAGGRQVAEIMSPDPVSLPAHALAYEAAVTMTARRIRHVLVMDEGQLIGVVSERDLFSLQRLGLGEISMELRLAGDLAVLAALAGEIRGLATRLVEQGVAAEQLTHFVSVLNDRLSQRVIEIVRKRHDLEHLSWCWLAFGSEGRFEQTLATDQDNGLVFVAHEGAAAGRARARILPFAREVNEALDACGFPLCSGNIMASNPELCLSLEEWQRKMAGWIEVSMPKALLEAAICFDFRDLYGDASLVVSLREWVAVRVKAHPTFLRHMAEAALQARPALGVLAGFATGDGPDGADTVNLKLHGIRPFVDAARVYALAFGLPQTGTAERLRAAVAGLRMQPPEMAAIVDAFFFIQRLRLRIQAQPGIQSRESANRINPRTLNDFERRGLKEALRQARKLQQRLALDYNL
jgi:CBS domain-containing protein